MSGWIWGSGPLYHFDISKIGPNVRVDNTCLHAEHNGNGEMGGVLFTDVPLVYENDVAMFEVIVEDAKDGEEDGLTIGVVQGPIMAGAHHVPTCADDVDPSWSVGFDGRAHIHEVPDMVPVKWSPRDLNIGDQIGFVVHTDGACCVTVNGKFVTHLPGKVPSGVELYGMIDLLGNTVAASLLGQPSEVPAELKEFCITTVQHDVMEDMYKVFAGTDPYAVAEAMRIARLVKIPDKVAQSAKNAMYKGPPLKSRKGKKTLQEKASGALHAVSNILHAKGNHEVDEDAVRPDATKNDYGRKSMLRKSRKSMANGGTPLLSGGDRANTFQWSAQSPEEAAAAAASGAAPTKKKSMRKSRKTARFEDDKQGGLLGDMKDKMLDMTPQLSGNKLMGAVGAGLGAAKGGLDAAKEKIQSKIPEPSKDPLEDLNVALASGDPKWIEQALNNARKAGVNAADLARGELALKEAPLVEKLRSALQSEEIETLRGALSEAKAAGISESHLAKYQSGLHTLEVATEKRLALAALRVEVAAENIDGIKVTLEKVESVEARYAKNREGARGTVLQVAQRMSKILKEEQLASLGGPDEVEKAKSLLQQLQQRFQLATEKLKAAVDKAKATQPPTVHVLRDLKEAVESAKLSKVETGEASALLSKLGAELAAAKKAAEDDLMACIDSRKASEINAKVEECKVFGSTDCVEQAMEKLAEIIKADLKRGHEVEREEKSALLPEIDALLNVYRVQKPGTEMLKKLHNDLQDLKGALRVFCRIRPLNKRELALQDTIVVKATSALDVNVISSKGERNDFSYDAIFLESNTQADVFSECQSLIQSSFDGYKITIFTYGQTGAGKTWTLYGIPEQPGVSPRTCTEVFEAVKKQSEFFDIEVNASMVELYNNMVRDLLSKEKPPPKLDIKNVLGPDGNTQVKLDATMVPCKDVPGLEAAVAKGFGNRKVASTSMNADSSRSHLLFMIYLNMKKKDTGVIRSGKITIVDLAGSERLAKSEVKGDAQKEAIEINKSLTALGDVMMAVSSKAKMVPYRNHKLTQLMQDSLGGTAKTLMFVNISPASNNADETINALKYASRARSIENEVAKGDAGGGAPASGSRRPNGKAKPKPKGANNSGKNRLAV